MNTERSYRAVERSYRAVETIIHKGLVHSMDEGAEHQCQQQETCNTHYIRNGPMTSIKCLRMWDELRMIIMFSTIWTIWTSNHDHVWSIN